MTLNMIKLIQIVEAQEDIINMNQVLGQRSLIDFKSHIPIRKKIVPIISSQYKLDL